MKNNLRHYSGPSRGLGDSIEKFTRLTGIQSLAQMGARAMGKQGCGCKGRQEALNKAIPYKSKLK